MHITKKSDIFVTQLSSDELFAMRFSFVMRYEKSDYPLLYREKIAPLMDERMKNESHDDKLAPYEGKLKEKKDYTIECTLDDLKAIVHFVGEDFKVLGEDEYQTIVGTDYDVVEEMLSYLKSFIHMEELSREMSETVREMDERMKDES